MTEIEIRNWQTFLCKEQELGQISKLDLCPILCKLSLMTLGVRAPVAEEVRKPRY
jgi:hypothetical protein